MYVRRPGPRAPREDMPWYRVRLTADQFNDRQHERLRLGFIRAYLAARRPKGMSLWLSRRTGGGVDLFFSPVCVAAEPGLFDRCNGIRCFAPKQAVELLAGNDYGLACHALCQRRLPTSTRSRLQLPAAYSCRTVCRLEEQARYQRHELAPFVRHYLDAWFPRRVGPF